MSRVVRDQWEIFLVALRSDVQVTHVFAERDFPLEGHGVVQYFLDIDGRPIHANFIEFLDFRIVVLP